MSILIARADEGKEQHAIPCHMHALSVLRRAQRAGLEWIRVEKPGHHCDFLVAALVEQMRTRPLEVPSCIVNMHPAEQERLGARFEPRSSIWPGAALHPLRRLVSEG